MRNIPKWPQVRVQYDKDDEGIDRVILATIAPNGSKFGAIHLYDGSEIAKKSATEKASDELNKRMQKEFPDPDKLTAEEYDALIALCLHSGPIFEELSDKLQRLKGKLG